MGWVKPRPLNLIKFLRTYKKTMPGSCHSYLSLKFIWYFLILFFILTWIALSQVIQNSRIKGKLVKKNNQDDDNDGRMDSISTFHTNQDNHITEARIIPNLQIYPKCHRFDNVPCFKKTRHFNSSGATSSSVFPQTLRASQSESLLKARNDAWERDSGIPLLTLNELYTPRPVRVPPRVQESGDLPDNSLKTPSRSSTPTLVTTDEPVEPDITDRVKVYHGTELDGVKGGEGTIEKEESTEIPSFNEWKQQMMVVAEREKAHAINNGGGGGTKEGDARENGLKGQDQHQNYQGKGHDTGDRLASADSANLSVPRGTTPSVPTTPTSTRPPANMNNYASLDCGAKVLHHNPEATNAGGVLNKNMDEYMLNPCSARIWFTFELCEPIQIKSIEIANLELFSSSPKEIRIHISDRYPTREWLTNKTFLAQDERKVQAFILDATMFARYVKVELLSHYGHEHYCPLTLVRVYGTSMIEEYDDAAHDNQQQHSDDDSSAMNQEKVETHPPLESKPLNLTASVERILTNETSSAHGQRSEDNITTVGNGLLETGPSVVTSPTGESHPEAHVNNISGNETVQALPSRNLLLSAKDAVVNIFNHATNALAPPDFSPHRIRKIETIIDNLTHTSTPPYMNGIEFPSAAVVQHLSSSGNETHVPSGLINPDQMPPNKSYNTAVASDSERSSSKEVDENRVPSASELRLSSPRTGAQVSGRSRLRRVCPSRRRLFWPSLSAPSCHVNDEELASLPSATRPTSHHEVSDTPGSVLVSSAPKDQEILTDDSTLTKAQALTYPTGGGGVIASHKESIFMRLNNRIKSLELNVSLSGRYLEELSKRYRKQMEDMATTFNKTAQTLNATAALAEQRYAEYKTTYGTMERELATMKELLEHYKKIRDSSWTLELPFLIHASLFVTQIILVLYLIYRALPRRVEALPQANVTASYEGTTTNRYTTTPLLPIRRGDPSGYMNGGHSIPKDKYIEEEHEFHEKTQDIPLLEVKKSISTERHPLPSDRPDPICIHKNENSESDPEEDKGIMEPHDPIPTSPLFKIALPKKKRKKMAAAIHRDRLGSAWNDPSLPWPRVILLPPTPKSHLHPSRRNFLGAPSFDNARFFGSRFSIYSSATATPSLSRRSTMPNNRRKYSHPIVNRNCAQAGEITCISAINGCRETEARRRLSTPQIKYDN